jgi:hypothetical protein
MRNCRDSILPLQILFINNMGDTTILRVAVTGSSGQLGTEFIRLAANHPRFHFTFLTRDVFPLDKRQNGGLAERESGRYFYSLCRLYRS